MKRFLATMAVLAATGFAAPRPTLAGYDTYLALGDSVTFGVGSPQFAADGQHDGDRGYVKIVADTLAIKNGGVRPNVVNLAISGDTTDSFLGNAAGSPNIEGPNAWARNTNYAALGLPANQYSAMVAEIGALTAGGHSVDFVTLSIGPNDLLALVAFATAHNIDPLTLFPATLQQISTNLGTILQTIGQLAPTATVEVLGTYNPLPSDPLFAGAIAALNQTIEGTVGVFPSNFHYVDVAGLFVGRETELTYIAIDPGNLHPTAEGYRLIANQITAVPEPSSLALIGPGAATMIVLAFRRRLKVA